MAGVYALVGVVLFGLGGMTLEDAMGSDWLTFVGFTCVGSGLVGIVAGGVSLGARLRPDRH